MHKLTAGSGYTYLTRQVAVSDRKREGRDGLADYYAEKGESPGRWIGRGLGGMSDLSFDASPALLPEDLFALGDAVTEAQMLALFGEGRHPNADAIERALSARGTDLATIEKATRLGQPFKVYDDATEFQKRTAIAYRDYNRDRNLRGDQPLPMEERARLRTEIATAMFTETHGRAPLDARELSGHLARISRQATTAVAGYDLTFSPVKSVSVLWAIAPREISDVVEAAHDEAVADTLAWLEDNAAYTRRGANGVRQVEVLGLIAASFTHRDTRAGDPELHTHLAVSNKVQTQDGTWLAVDGRPLFKNVVVASERYNTRLECLLRDRLGVVFADRAQPDPRKRPVREIVGVDGKLPAAWSSRRAAIDVRRAELSAAFQAQHGRPPTPKEAIALAQQANLETRAKKHEPRSHAEQRATWRAEALTVFGDERGLADYVSGALAPAAGLAPATVHVDRAWLDEQARGLLATVARDRAVWQPNHVRAEAERLARHTGIDIEAVDHVVDSLVHVALSAEHSIALNPAEPVGEPAALQRSDGTSVYTVKGSEMFTSTAVIRAEATILDAAARRDGRALASAEVDLAIIESAANQLTLNPGQSQLVHALASSGARVQLALAPAGTGKTTAMGVLTRAWAASGGTVVGLAPSAAAAAVLREDIGTDTDTLAKLVHHLHRAEGTPAWMQNIDATTLLIIDEAGMAATADLAETIDYAIRRGASVRLIGDDQQLAAIGAGGVLRDIAREHGEVTLSQVMRFTDPQTKAPNHSEGAASLALREGDASGLAHYIDHQRVHVGDLTTSTDDAYTAWAKDRAAGRDSLMLAPTRELVDGLNQRARDERLAAMAIATTTPDTPDRPNSQDSFTHTKSTAVTHAEVRLANGAHASAGDTIITRTNERRLALSTTDWVKNGDRWTVTSVRPDGALHVTHLGHGLSARLPASYVAEHVDLGYATTVHGAQGVTADTSHTVATGEENRQLLYVSMTRGRHENHVYLATASTGEEHTAVHPDTLHPLTAIDILTKVLDRDASPVSVNTARHDLAHPIPRLTTATETYTDTLAVAAVSHLGATAMADLDDVAERLVPGVSLAPAWPTLRGSLALIACTGTTVKQALAGALADPRGTADARDIAALLDWRLDATGGQSRTGRSALAWLPAAPSALTRDPQWGPYLLHRRTRLDERVADVAALAAAWTPTSAPAWAVPLLAGNRGLVGDLAAWRAAHDIPDSDPRPTGPPRMGAAEQRHQRALTRRVQNVLGNPASATTRWRPLVEHLEPRVLTDPYWPTLAENLTAAERAGINIAALAHTAAATRPLPDEMPATALWWRLAAHLAPAALNATATSATTGLRPEWTPALSQLLSDTAAARVVADPAWPALVAAVTHASQTGWTPEQVLAAAHELLITGQDDDAPLRAGEYATALTWRVELLTAPADIPDLIRDPANPAERPGSATFYDEEYDPDLDPESTIPEDYTPELNDSDVADASAWNAAAIADYFNAGDAAFGVPAGPPVPRLVGADGTLFPGAGQTDPEARARQRILEVNTIAADFFKDRYPGSWAAEHVATRLGTDLVDDPRWGLGYAPAQWTALTDHLRTVGVLDSEILTAGLGTTASNGRVIDRFRDRLMFPIRHEDTVVGWIGRRHPERTDVDKAGPKYLNTADNPAFAKGHHLYGLTEAAPALERGTIPALVEGPMDAIAVTLAGDDRYVGVAPLGTSFTAVQADQLRPHIPRRGQPGIIVATDNDDAGREAATRAYWRLTARGDNPLRLTIPSGKDPAEFLQIAGPGALRSALETSHPLSRDVTTERMSPYLDRLDTAGQVNASRRAADAVGALHPSLWAAGISAIQERTGALQEVAANDVLAAGDAWLEDPAGQEAKRLRETRWVSPPPTVMAAQADRPVNHTSPVDGPTRTGHPAAPPSEKSSTAETHEDPAPPDPWETLAESLHPGITADPEWQHLADTLRRAASLGYDVNANLQHLMASRPIDNPKHAARTLDLRLIRAIPAALTTSADTGARTQAIEDEPATDMDQIRPTPAPRARPRPR